MTPPSPYGQATVTPLQRPLRSRHPDAGARPGDSDLVDLAFERAPVGLWLACVHADGPATEARLLRVNRAFADLVGYGAGELLDRGDQQSYTHPADVEEDLVQLSLLAAGPPRGREWVKRFRHADGHVVWAAVGVWRVESSAGGAVLMMGRAEELDPPTDEGRSDEHQELVRMRALCGQLQHALDSRVVIEQAKGMVAAQRRITVNQAFERIRKHARSHSVDVHEVAAAVVNVGLIP